MVKLRNIVIAIDGPSGSGKSTLGKALAQRLGFLYIDSGAVYRAVACKAIDGGVSMEDQSGIVKAARAADISLEGAPDGITILLDGRDVTRRIRLPDATRGSSIVATIPEVRNVVVSKLRRMSKTGGVVMDGRDIGTRVFPDADVKLFLDASLDVRAGRRSQEESERGRRVSIEEIRDEIAERDHRDIGRAATPLVKAADAILIDTTGLTIEALIEHALEIVERHG